MGFFGEQLANVVEWQDAGKEVMLWKWPNDEIKKGSRLIIRPGQNAIFMKNGSIEGLFKDEGSFDIESQIIPFLSTLKGFKFGFNSGMRCEVLFVNTLEMTGKWGTKNPIMLQAPGLPGGLPIRAFGSFVAKVDDEITLLDKVAGVKTVFTMEDVRDRMVSKLDQYMMKRISQEGKDIFRLQAYADEISKGIIQDLDAEMKKIGIAITDFAISNVSYPDNVQKMAENAAAASMVQDPGHMQQVGLGAQMMNGGQGGSAGSMGSNMADMATTMAGMAAGMQMGQQMMNSMNNGSQAAPQQAAPAQQGAGSQAGAAPAGQMNFCPNCGTKVVPGTRFCSNCGYKLS